MSGNQQIVASLYAAFAQRDVARIMDIADAQIVIEQSARLPWGGRYEGHQGLQAFFGKLLSHINSQVTIEEYLESGDEVMAIGWTRGQVLKNSAPFQVRIVHVWRLRDGKAIEFHPRIDDHAMLAALNG